MTDYSANNHASGGSIWGEMKRGGRFFAILSCLALAACDTTVRPTALEIADRIDADGADFSDVAEWLAPEGYKRWSPHPSSRWPLPDGVRCIEKSVSGGPAGVDVVRICSDSAGQVSSIDEMATHGFPWRRVWPERAIIGPGWKAR